METTSCPMCDGLCEGKVSSAFLFCPRCDLAVRRKDTIPVDRQQGYGANWVMGHSKDRGIGIKADFMLGLVRKTITSGKVLDVGCASGVLVDKLVTAGYDATGIDWSVAAITFASDNMRGEYMWGDADLECIDGNQIYDMIVASHIVEHLENTRGLLEGAKRLLKDGGYLLVAVPNLAWYSRRSIWRRVSSIFDHDHVAGYTPVSLSKLLMDSGFGISGIITRTHDVDLLTAACVTMYGRMVRRGEQRDDVKTTEHSGCSDGLFQTAYGRIVSLPLFPLLSYIPNRLSERGHRGMELIIIARNC